MPANSLVRSEGVGGLNPQRAFRRYPTRPHARIFFPAENISEFKSESKNSNAGDHGPRNQRKSMASRTRVISASTRRLQNRVFISCRALAAELVRKIVAKFRVGGGGCLTSLQI